MATFLRGIGKMPPPVGLKVEDRGVRRFIDGLQSGKDECISRFRFKRGRSAIRPGKPTARLHRDESGRWVWVSTDSQGTKAKRTGKAASKRRLPGRRRGEK
jgi:hypothetical protein